MSTHLHNPINRSAICSTMSTYILLIAFFYVESFQSHLPPNQHQIAVNQREGKDQKRILCSFCDKTQTQATKYTS